MRKSKLTVDEIEAAEIAADDRKTSRGHGFNMISIRDRGGARLDNGAIIEWYVPQEKRADYVPYRNIPSGHFMLTIGKETGLFSVDEFQKYIRWA